MRANILSSKSTPTTIHMTHSQRRTTKLAKDSKALTRSDRSINKSRSAPQKNCELVIVDVSGSMGSMVTEGVTRISCLREALKSYRGLARVLAFSTNVENVEA